MLQRLQFSLWYFFRPPWDSGISPPELLQFIAGHSAGRAIDLGCGTGTNVITLARAGWHVTGVDFAPRAIQKARSKLRRAGLAANLHVADVTSLRLGEAPFDLALDIGCFHGLEQREAYLTALGKLLAPGGYWLMYGFLRDSASDSGSGLDEHTLSLINSHGLIMRSRTDGTDKYGRPSAWFLFQRSAPISAG